MLRGLRHNLKNFRTEDPCSVHSSMHRIRKAWRKPNTPYRPIGCGPRASCSSVHVPAGPLRKPNTVWFGSPRALLQERCRARRDCSAVHESCTASPKPNSGGEALLGPALRGTIADLAGARARRLVLGSCRSGARKANHALRACDSRRLRGVRPVRERGEALLARAG